MSSIGSHSNFVSPRGNGVSRKLPVGVCLLIGAGVSLALWTVIGLGLKALLT